jgi:hypothetical protein
LTSKQIAFVAGAVICILSAPAASQSSTHWVDIKDANELRALHSNKTFKGTGGDGTSFVAHYRSDGKALLIHGGQRIARTWEIKGDDQVCYSDAVFPGCRKFQRSKENSNEFSAIWGFSSAIFSVEDGIPQF